MRYKLIATVFTHQPSFAVLVVWSSSGPHRFAPVGPLPRQTYQDTSTLSSAKSM